MNSVYNENLNVVNTKFYITESLFGDVKQYSLKEYYNRILKQYPTYDILTHFKDGKKIVNQKNKLTLDFDGKNQDDFDYLIECLNSIPDSITFCCSGYVKPVLAETLPNINSITNSNHLIYFDIKDNVDDIFSCHVIFNVAITTDEFINIKQDLLLYNFYDLNELLDNSIFTNGRKMRHTLTDKDNKDRKINLNNLKSWLNDIGLTLEEFLNKSSPQYLDTSAISYSEFKEHLELFPVFEVDDIKPNTINSSAKTNTKTNIKTNIKTNTKPNSINRSSIFYYLYNKQTDKIETLTEDNKISNYNLGQLLFGFGHSVLSLEELTQEIALLPYYEKFPNEIDTLIDYIKPEQDLKNISPLFCQMTRLNTLIKQDEENKIEDKDKLELKKQLQIYIHKYLPQAFILNEYVEFEGIDKFYTILQNVCWINGKGYYIKTKRGTLRATTLQDIENTHNITNIKEKLTLSIVSFESYKQIKQMRAMIHYEKDKAKYDDIVIHLIDIFKQTFKTEKEYDLFYHIIKNKILHPQNPPRFGIIQYGAANSCKTRTTEMLDLLLDYQAITSETLLSNFNSWVQNDIVNIEELPETTKETGKVIEKLKAYTKTNNVSLELKGRNQENITPAYLIIINTNFRSLGGLFDKKVNIEPLLARFRIIERIPLTAEGNAYINQHLLNAESLERAAIEVAYVEYIKNNNYQWTDDLTELEIEQQEKANNEDLRFQILTSPTVEECLNQHARITRINIRKLTSELNRICRVDMIDAKFDPKEIRNELINRDIARLSGTNTICINIEKFKTLFTRPLEDLDINGN